MNIINHYYFQKLWLGLIATTSLLVIPEVVKAGNLANDILVGCNPGRPNTLPDLPCDPNADISVNVLEIPGFTQNAAGIDGEFQLVTLPPNNQGMMSGIVVENPTTGFPVSLNMDFIPPSQNNPVLDPNTNGTYLTSVNSSPENDFNLLGDKNALIQDLQAGSCPQCSIAGTPYPPPAIRNFIVINPEGIPPVVMDGIDYESIAFDLYSVGDFSFTPSDLGRGTILTTDMQMLAYKVNSSGQRIEEHTLFQFETLTELRPFVNEVDVTLTIAVPQPIDVVTNILSTPGRSLNSTSVLMDFDVTSQSLVYRTQVVPEPITILGSGLVLSLLPVLKKQIGKKEK